VNKNAMGAAEMTQRGDQETKAHLPLSNLAFHILLALGGGAAHGYAIGKEVEERSNGKLNPTTGSLYQALKRLQDTGLIEPAQPTGSVDSRRQYFRLTCLGRKVAALEARRLDGLVAAARSKKLYNGSV
jgi:DNA-binding PadR family transcriptional regulator